MPREFSPTRVEWGPVDAAIADTQFHKKLIFTQEIEELLKDRYWLISGEKGAGKTAIRRIIEAQSKATSDTCAYVDYDETHIVHFRKGLENLSQALDVAPHHILTHFWAYLLVYEISAALRVQYEDAPNVWTPLSEIGGEAKRVPMRNYGQIIGMLIDRTLAIFEIDDSEQKKAEAREYPTNQPDYIAQVESLAGYLRDKKRRVVLVLDGFDRFIIRDAKRVQVQAIFEALREAVYSMAIHSQLGGLIQIKALIPHDRYVLMGNARDGEKFNAIHRPIVWSRASLYRFVARRINVSLGSFEAEGRAQDDALWKKIFPENVRNLTYKCEENSFEYVLRHTMWRPRHLQLHLIEITEQCGDGVAKGSLIRQAITSSCKSMARQFLAEYAVDYPRLGRFFEELKDKCNVMSKMEVLRLIETAWMTDKSGDTLAENVEASFAMLYRIGVIGVLEKLAKTEAHGRAIYSPPTLYVGEKYRFVFYFHAPKRYQVPSDVAADALVGIHPMLLDFCGQRPHPTIIVG